MKHGMLKRATYSLVSSGTDPMTGVLTDESLNDGIQFKAKFIGSMEVPRPTNRVEIVAAMRAIRYEFREKGIKKTKIDISISTTGVSVMKRSKAKLWKWMSVDEEDGKLLMQHPVFRIFYVSHDSQDLQIFSYIACDSANLFKCFVFKASDKHGAVHVVRAIGQVFDVCHRLQQQTSDSETPVVDAGEIIKPDEDVAATIPSKDDHHLAQKKGDQSGSVVVKSDSRTGVELPQKENLPDVSMIGEVVMSMEEHATVSKHFGVVLYQQLHLESLKSQNLAAEVELLQTQLKAETAARINLQGCVHELAQQNQRLIQYIKKLDDIFTKRHTESASNQLIDLHSSPKQISFPQLSSIPQTLTSPFIQGDSVLAGLSSHGALSPDSGHREMSSEGCASGCTDTPSEGSWYSAVASATVSSSLVPNGSGTSRNDLVSRSEAKQDSVLRDTSPQVNGVQRPSSNGVLGVQSSVSANPAASKCNKSGMKLALDERGCGVNSNFFSKFANSSFLTDPDSLCVGDGSFPDAKSFPQLKLSEVT